LTSCCISCRAWKFWVLNTCLESVEMVFSSVLSIPLPTPIAITTAFVSCLANACTIW
jgi:hypothetical protein